MTGTALAQSPSKNSLLISPGDNIHITVLDMPNMEQHARVTDAGDVPVQGIGNVRVVNMSPAEAATAIHDRYVSSHFLNHPQVAVVVDQYATAGSDADRGGPRTRCLSDCDPPSHP